MNTAAEQSPDAIISIRHVSKSYGNTIAIDDVSLDVASGEFISLLGPSGSGKSTILMMIAGFVTPSGGEIYHNGRPLGTTAPEKRNFGVVFQGYALFPHMTVRQNIGYPLKLRNVSRSDLERQVEKAMDLVHLSDLADRMPAQLSGGQQQRVALARALVFEPEVVLLDEPLSALDKKLRAELQIELKSLHERLKTTFINVTHDQEEAMTMSDRIVILENGRVQQIGAPSDLYNNPRTRFVANFLGRANFLNGNVVSTEQGRIEVSVDGNLIQHSCTLTPPPPGSPAVLAIRPERLSLVDNTDPTPRANCFQGRVRRSVFVGSQHGYVVETALGDIEVSSQSFDTGPLRKPGEPVLVAWPCDASILVE